MIHNRLRLYDPDWESLKMPDLDLKALEPNRDTHIVKDKFNEYHISQRRDGITQIISLDERELKLILEALQQLLERKE